jgi:Bacterial transcriptional activator domain
LTVRWSNVGGERERIQLCGHFLVRSGSERLDEKLRGRQARRLFAFLILNRTRFMARDDRSEALRTYERLRCVLRDELGTSPGPGARAIHERLLARTSATRPDRDFVRQVATFRGC